MQRNIIRYMNILRLAGEIIEGYGKYPDPSDVGTQRARAIYSAAFEELIRQGMPYEDRGEMAVIETDGEEYAVLRQSLGWPVHGLGSRPLHQVLDQPATEQDHHHTENPYNEQDHHHTENPYNAEITPGDDVHSTSLDITYKTGLMSENHFPEETEEEYYDDDNIDETYIHTPDELEDEAEEDLDEEEAIDADDISEEEMDTGSLLDKADENTGTEEETVEVYSAVDDDVTIEDTDDGYPGEPPAEHEAQFIEPDEPNEPDEPEIQEGPVPKEPNEPEGPEESSEPDEPEEPGEPDEPEEPSEPDEPEPAPVSVPSAAVEDRRMNHPGRSVEEMGPSLHRDDFTYSNGVVEITAPNGTIIRARLLSMPLSTDIKEPEFVLMCAVEGKNQSIRSAQGRMKLDIDGYKGIFSAKMVDGYFRTQFELEKEFSDRGVVALYKRSSGGDGTGGHIVCKDDEGETRVHILPAKFKNTKEGTAEQILYYLERSDRSFSGVASKKKPLRFMDDGIMVECRCTWKDDVLGSIIEPVTDN